MEFFGFPGHWRTASLVDGQKLPVQETQVQGEGEEEGRKWKVEA